VSNLPKSFPESGISPFFGQFGDIKQFKLARSKKTGRPQRFVYVQYEYDVVPPIVADGLKNYVIDHNVIYLSVVPFNEKLFKPTRFSNPGILPDEVLDSLEQRTGRPERRARTSSVNFAKKVEEKVKAMRRKGVDFVPVTPKELARGKRRKQGTPTGSKNKKPKLGTAPSLQDFSRVNHFNALDKKIDEFAEETKDDEIQNDIYYRQKTDRQLSIEVKRGLLKELRNKGISMRNEDQAEILKERLKEANIKQEKQLEKLREKNRSKKSSE